MRQSKYEGLTQFLFEYPEDKCTLSFDEIENIIGEKLPDSVFTHLPEWWSNGNQNYALHWLEAGFVVTQYNMSQHFAFFIKNKSLADDYISRCVKAPRKCKSHLQAVRQINNTPDVSCSDLLMASEKYFDEIRKDEHARFLSWEHCYSFFQKNRHHPSAEQLDLLCLHLAGCRSHRSGIQPDTGGIIGVKESRKTESRAHIAPAAGQVLITVRSDTKEKSDNS